MVSGGKVSFENPTIVALSAALLLRSPVELQFLPSPSWSGKRLARARNDLFGNATGVGWRSVKQNEAQRCEERQERRQKGTLLDTLRQRPLRPLVSTL